MRRLFYLGLFFIILAPSLALGAAEEYPQGSGNWYPGSYSNQSLSRNDVQDAVNAASGGKTYKTGDIVHLKAGSATWGGTVNITKKIQVIGQGIGSTKISGKSIKFFKIDSAARLSGVELIWTAPESGDIAIGGKFGPGFRIDHCKLHNPVGKGYYGINAVFSSLPPYPHGVIDNNYLKNVRIYIGTTNTKHYNQAWSDPASFGMAETIFIEDNIFDSSDRSNAARNQIDGRLGARFVVRFNTVIGAAIENHGAYSGNLPSRGTRIVECYNNILEDDKIIESGDSKPFFMINFRSGTGLIFNNQWNPDGHWGAPYITLDNNEERRGACKGSSTADGNLTSDGYPCRDGIGTIRDEFKWPKDGTPVPKQEHQPWYVWGNTDDKVRPRNDPNKKIRRDRDYVSAENDGVRTGSWSNRPGTCEEYSYFNGKIVARQGYWATDQGGDWNTDNKTSNDGALYQCDGNNNWVLFYKPYTYPHPLRKGTELGELNVPLSPSAAWITQ